MGLPFQRARVHEGGTEAWWGAPIANCKQKAERRSSKWFESFEILKPHPTLYLP